MDDWDDQEKKMDGKEESLANEIIDLEKAIKKQRDLIKDVLDNSDKESPVYLIANELHEEISRLNARLSEYRVGKFTLEDMNDAIKDYEKLGENLKLLMNLIRNLSER